MKLEAVRKWARTAAAVAVWGGLTAAIPARAAVPRNVLLITIDTLRADRVGAYGNPNGLTPALDALAREGTVFERAYAHVPLTLPSHACILLGLTPPEHGVRDNSGYVVREGSTTLAGTLKKQGFATAAFVGSYAVDSRFGLNQGFDLYDDNYGSQKFQEAVFVERRAGAVVDGALRWLEGRREPWFLWVHCYDPHAPYEPPEPYKSRFAAAPYDGEVAYTDSQLARIFNRLREDGLLEQTLVVVTADHGEGLGDHSEPTHGYFAYESTLRVPLIVRAPGVKAGRVSSTVAHVDIFPTVCEALGLRPPSGLQGRALPEAGRKAPAERDIYFECLYPYYSRGWAPLKGFLASGWKFIDSPIPELYNLAKDPGEKTNLVKPETLGQFKMKLRTLETRLGGGSAASAKRPVDRETAARLRSLGYVSGGAPVKNRIFGPADDVKTRVPFANRVEKAADLAKAGKPEAAIRELKAVLTERDDTDVGYTVLAGIYRSQGRLADALTVLKAGLDRLPDNYEILIVAVSSNLFARRYEEVLRLVESCTDPRRDADPEIWNSVGVAHARMGNEEKARLAYNQALSIDRDFPAAWNNLGALEFLSARRTGDQTALTRAASAFKEALRADPQSAPAYNGLGAVARASGDLDGAIAAWERAAGPATGSPEAAYNLGQAYYDRGDKAKALSQFLRYKALRGATLNASERAEIEEWIRKCK
jgi:arylsulfatase A-like enzyme/Flp pilus assembly protein TadD